MPGFEWAVPCWQREKDVTGHSPARLDEAATQGHSVHNIPLCIYSHFSGRFALLVVALLVVVRPTPREGGIGNVSGVGVDCR